MTTSVSVYLTRADAVTGIDTGQDGSLDYTPTRRRHVDAPAGDPTDRIVLPASGRVRLVDGRVTMLLAATGPDWCWKITERVTGGITRYVAVPDMASVEYGDLIDVDPTTLDPAAEPEAAWWAFAEDLQTDWTAAIDATAASATAADVSADAAAVSETNAAGSATSAESAQASAETAETNAATSAAAGATSETNAAASETAASGSATSAGTLATASATSATASATSATSAQTARTGAETAKTSAAGSATTATTQAGIATTQAGIATAASVIKGTGSPEGVVTASVGAEYVDMAITTGAFKWAKKSGTGNTGWKVIDGDTGWRDISGLSSSNFHAVNVQIHRVNSTVEMYGIATKTNADSAFELFNPTPVGFSRQRTAYLPILVGSSQLRAIHAVAYSPIINQNQVATFQHTWTTQALWPTTLPGTPA